MAALSKEPKTKGPTAAARARKRRIALRNKQTAAVGEVIDCSEDSSTKAKRARIEGEVPSGQDTDKPSPSITGIKKASRYVPGVPMTKDELKAWRKEARRVRNRESAAASRKRNKERIDELEAELDAMKSKYTAALQYIVGLEGNSSKEHFTPETLRQDLSSMRPEPCPSPSIPSMSVPLTLNLEENHFDNDLKKNQHIMISRPIAAKTPGADSSIGHSHVIPPPSSTSSDCSTASQDSVVASDTANSDDSYCIVDESELGEFLMDTFEGLDSLEISGLPVGI